MVEINILGVLAFLTMVGLVMSLPVVLLLRKLLTRRDLKLVLSIWFFQPFLLFFAGGALTTNLNFIVFLGVFFAFVTSLITKHILEKSKKIHKD